jgi:hypothetical protein
VRGLARARGAMAPGLIFSFFFIKKKEHKLVTPEYPPPLFLT